MTYENVSILPGNVASYKAYTEIKPVNLNLSGKFLQSRHVTIAFKIAAIKYDDRFSLGPDVWALAVRRMDSNFKFKAVNVTVFSFILL